MQALQSKARNLSEAARRLSVTFGASCD